MIQLIPFLPRGPGPWDHAPATVGPVEGHVVQFYERDDFLLQELTEFVSAGLRQDEAVIVIASAAHRVALHCGLESAGFEPESISSPGRLIMLDAEETLGLIMSDGWPDAEAFQRHVGRLIQRAGSGGRRVRAFGEMVAVLLEQGRSGATLALEALWNSLIDRVPIQRLCAYPLRAFRGCDESVFVRVCNAHAKVLPAEGYSGTHADEAYARAVSLSQLRERCA